MKRFLSLLPVVLLGFLLSSSPYAQETTARTSQVPQTAEWQRLSTLVGLWEGVSEQGGQSVTATLEVRMTGDRSAIMHLMGKDSPHEMLTMFHPDGERLLATHYCAAHNQPRMAMVPATKPGQVAFEFVDGTNIAPGDGHIKGVVLTFIDADHHEEAWTSSASPTPAVFKYTRKK